MLELKNIKKNYITGAEVVEALKGVDLVFRKSEFVSILGQSGCGKTTMLNIIGGLAQYSDGDLIIDGVSTKEYSDRDWDTYRNHTIGFVFQSYNLIPHQTVLQNVELALTLSGVSKSERRERAKKALEEVGLGDQLKKLPSEMSGGQMQRVAIARALVNNPEIILADEPTGALDSETSVQVMNILKKISNERLVIMVTHNPELAETYSTRIVKMLDGLITDDSNPLTEKEYNDELEVLKNKKLEEEKLDSKELKKLKRKSSMSLLTSFGLSLKNLFTKKGRTILTSFAGSVGIIGIALISAVSQGATSYINTVQEDTLGSYPLTLQAENVNLGSLLTALLESTNKEIEHDKNHVYEQNTLYEFIDAINSIEVKQNDLKSFKSFLETEMKDETSSAYQAVSGIQYTYNLNLQVYTESVDNTIIPSDANVLMSNLMIEYMGELMGNITSSMGDNSQISSMMNQSNTVWQEMVPGENGRLVSSLIEKQYDVVYGSWPTKYNEIVLVLDENNEIDNISLYALGLKPESEMREIMDAAIKHEPITSNNNKWTYEEIVGMKFKTILSSDCYQALPTENGSDPIYIDLRSTDAGLRYLFDQKGLDLEISGIIRPNDDTLSPMIKGSIGYTSKLTEYVIENAKDKPAIIAQQSNPTKDIFTGMLFKNSAGLTNEEKETVFRDYVAGLNVNEKANLYVDIQSIPSDEFVKTQVESAMKFMTRDMMEEMIVSGFKEQTQLTEEQIRGYVDSMSDEEITGLIANAISEQVKTQYSENVKSQMATIPNEQKATLLDAELPSYTNEQCVNYYENVMEFSNSTYENNLIKLGYVDMDSPKTINLYASSFANKELIEKLISDYNKSVAKEKQIEYVDYVGLMMSSVTTIIDAITYVLIAFVAVSLVVSSIMIGVITLISVQERTKEIGVLRALGASKKDVSHLFNAETVIVGFSAGLLGIGVTYLLCIPINIILRIATGIPNLRAIFPIDVALILIALSVVLTLIAGIIPSRSASKKDPVEALRTE